MSKQKKTNKQHNASTKARAEKTSTTKRVPKTKGAKAKKAKSASSIESQKIDIAAFRLKAIQKTLPGYLEGEQVIHADLDVMKQRFLSREGTRVELDDLNGQDIHEFDLKHRAGHEGKMPNGMSTYKTVAEYENFPVAEKQLRRLHDRWKLILEFRANDISEPRLGVTHFDAVKPMVDIEEKLEALRDAEENGLSVAELREKYIESKKKSKKGWKALLRSNASRINISLMNILGLMEQSGDQPDREVLAIIKDIKVLLNRFKVSQKEVA